MAESIIGNLSMNFAIPIVKFYKFLTEKKRFSSSQNNSFGQGQALAPMSAKGSMPKVVQISSIK